MDVAQGDAAEAGRLLARARWGSRGVDKAIEVLRSRAADLDEGQRAELRELSDVKGVTDDR